MFPKMYKFIQFQTCDILIYQEYVFFLEGTTPGDVNQVSYYRKKLRKEQKSHDEFQEILLYSSNDEVGKHCIRNLQFHSKGFRFVFSIPAQLEEIIASCTAISSPCGILSIDTTFNIGNFFMTPTSYALKAFINKRTKKHVNVPGPCLFHVEEESSEVYLYFAHSLVEANPDIDRVRFIGGDRGKGQREFMRPFRSATLLPCTRHVQSNILEKIPDKGAQKQILRDLFGSTKHMQKGLVDCVRSSFDSTLSSMAENWPPEFVNYFKTHVEDDMKNGMLADIREAAGLGDELYYNNALECLNKKLKNKKREKQGSSFRRAMFPSPSSDWTWTICPCPRICAVWPG